jgi:uncharacterized membrane protein
LNIIGSLVGVGSFLHIVMILGLFIPGTFILFSSRRKILKLFLLIPKDVVGKTYHQLKRKSHGETRSNVKKVIPVGLQVFLM